MKLIIARPIARAVIVADVRRGARWRTPGRGRPAPSEQAVRLRRTGAGARRRPARDHQAGEDKPPRASGTTEASRTATARAPAAISSPAVPATARARPVPTGADDSRSASSGDTRAARRAGPSAARSVTTTPSRAARASVPGRTTSGPSGRLRAEGPDEPAQARSDGDPEAGAPAADRSPRPSAPRPGRRRTPAGRSRPQRAAGPAHGIVRSARCRTCWR